jgi:multidrug transporter EmrE-like cation transporter
LIFFSFLRLGTVQQDDARDGLDLSAAYATWSGVGTALTAIVGFFVFKEAMTVKK